MRFDVYKLSMFTEKAMDKQGEPRDLEELRRQFEYLVSRSGNNRVYRKALDEVDGLLL